MAAQGQPQKNPNEAMIKELDEQLKIVALDRATIHEEMKVLDGREAVLMILKRRLESGMLDLR